MAQIEFDACGFSERQHVFQTGERTFKQKSDPRSPPHNQHHPPLFHSKGSVHWFNSQESQLKARTGLTYIQWCEIDQRHPAWTNHSTEGEASQQADVKSTGSNDRANGLENAADDWGEKGATLSLPSYLPCL